MATAEKHAFQAEIGQLLEIVTHSLYTDKEIFVRELISNAADATEKLKFLQTSGAEIHQPELPLNVVVTTDDQAKTITIADHGIGMTHEELIENLGTIAHSGSRAFLERVKANKSDANLIGQFGVGFYSAFMVADKVTVYTRSSQAGAEGCIWSSDGAGGYEIETANDLERGTRIVLHLKESESEFAQDSRVEQIIKHYSNFVQFPIELNGKTVNTVQALWTKNKSELTDDDYTEFYKYIAHDTAAPQYRLHFSADAPLAIRALLFVPEKSYELFTLTRGEPEVHLYCRKILIQARAKALFPEWLRFLRGVVDSEDLPLNISRESMQDSALMKKLNEVLTKRVLKWLDEESKDAEKYAKFFAQHGHCLKEGVATDWTHRDSLAKLLRFDSSHTEAGKTTSLPDYVSRMPEAQKEIYYLVAQSREAAEASPYFEVFRAKGWEVLFLTQPQDEFVMDHLGNFDGKRIVAAEKADVALDEEKTHALSDDEAGQLATFIKETLGERVNDVRVSKRLTGSPAVVVDKDTHMTTSMRRVMKMMQQREGGSAMGLESKPDLEINPDHAAIIGLEKKRHADSGLAAQVAEQIFDSALMSAGLLEDPRAMLARINQLLERVLGAEKA